MPLKWRQDPGVLALMEQFDANIKDANPSDADYLRLCRGMVLAHIPQIREDAQRDWKQRVTELETLLMDYMHQQGFSFMSHEEAACTYFGHTLPSREFNVEYWQSRVPPVNQPCWCLAGPVQTKAAK